MEEKLLFKRSVNQWSLFIFLYNDKIRYTNSCVFIFAKKNDSLCVSTYF